MKYSNAFGLVTSKLTSRIPPSWAVLLCKVPISYPFVEKLGIPFEISYFSCWPILSLSPVGICVLIHLFIFHWKSRTANDAADGRVELRSRDNGRRVKWQLSSLGLFILLTQQTSSRLSDGINLSRLLKRVMPVCFLSLSLLPVGSIRIDSLRHLGGSFFFFSLRFHQV